MEFREEVIKLQQKINQYIDQLNIPNTKNKLIYEAMKYSLNAGGKRIRPILCLKTYELFNENIDEVMELAMAIEYIHTYSLIHDDLPAMDNDDYRRGIPTNHKVFGENIAILAGDALLNDAYEKLIAWAIGFKDPIRGLNAIKIIANAAGVEGMIGGQVLDVQTNNQKVDEGSIRYIQENKTSALIEASVLSAAVAYGADENQIQSLKNYARNIGISFQIKDDILDVISSFEELGKDIGSDAENNKATFLDFHSIEESELIVASMKEEAISEARTFENSEFLVELAEYLVSRKK